MKRKFEFSKLLMVFETCIVGMMSICTLYFCYLSIKLDYTGVLPYLTTMTTAAWAAYGASAAFYYNKSKQENTEGGIVYEAAMKSLDKGGSI